LIIAFGSVLLLFGDDESRSVKMNKRIYIKE
jgi:hypothetical protein